MLKAVFLVFGGSAITTAALVMVLQAFPTWVPRVDTRHGDHSVRWLGAVVTVRFGLEEARTNPAPVETITRSPGGSTRVPGAIVILYPLETETAVSGKR